MALTTFQTLWNSTLYVDSARLGPDSLLFTSGVCTLDDGADDSSGLPSVPRLEQFALAMAADPGDLGVGALA